MYDDMNYNNYTEEDMYGGLNPMAMMQPDALGRIADDVPLNSYGFPYLVKENGKIDKSQSVCYMQVPMGFEYNKEWLQALRFSQNELAAFDEVLNLLGRMTEKRLRARVNLRTNKPYYTAGDIAILMYMYNFCVRPSNSVLLNDFEFLTKHLNKLYNLRNAENPNAMRGSISQISRQVLQTFGRKFDRFPRRVEIKGIEDEVFSIYNSENYVKYDKLYMLDESTKVGSEYVTIITDKSPRLKWRAKKSVDDVCYLSLVDDETGKYKNEALYNLKINRDYVVFRPTFYVYLTIKDEPGVRVDGVTYYLNHYKIVGETGVVITVAIGVHQLGKNERNKISASENVQAVAYYTEEAQTLLVKVAKEVYGNPAVRGIKAITVNGNCTLEDFMEMSKNMTVEEREEYEYEKQHQDSDDDELY